jgi:hypothetical protein
MAVVRLVQLNQIDQDMLEQILIQYVGFGKEMIFVIKETIGLRQVSFLCTPDSCCYRH